MEFVLFFQEYPTAFMVLVGIFGLIIGSFLNVLIYRLPLMMQSEWHSQCIDYLEISEDNNAKNGGAINLFSPRSHCPHCKHQIGALENVPILSYLFLHGKCKHCRKAISLRYPAIEIFCLVVSLLVAYQFGLSWETLTALIFTWGLMALSFIDIDHQLLPDDITMPLLWLGLLISLFDVFVPLQDALVGVLTGYLVLWITAWVFKAVTGKVGIAPGDFKLLAMLGAWTGWQLLPFIIVFASFSGAVIGISMVLMRKAQRSTPIPFGPYLAIAGWTALMWSETLVAYYFSFLKL